MTVLSNGYKTTYKRQPDWVITCREARDFAEDLNRAACEAEDHGSFVVVLRDAKDSIVFRITPHLERNIK